MIKSLLEMQAMKTQISLHIKAFVECLLNSFHMDVFTQSFYDKRWE